MEGVSVVVASEELGVSGRWAIVLAAVALVLGWAAILFTLFGPTYSYVEATLSESGVQTSQSGSRSLIEVGLNPLTLVVLVAIGIAYLLVLGGAIRSAQGRSSGRRMMAAAIAPVVAINAISMGLVLLAPATLTAVAATILAFLKRRTAG
jgi:hypothetical protein